MSFCTKFPLPMASRSAAAGRARTVVVRASDDGVSISPIARKAGRAKQRQQREAAKLAAQAAAPPASYAEPASSNGVYPTSSSTNGVARVVSTSAPPPPTRQWDPSPQSSSGQPTSSSGNYEILEAFFYGRAFAITLSKKLSELVVDLVAEVSKAAAERPQRIQEFQDEVSMLARKDMEASSVTPRASTSSNGASTSSSSSNATTTRSATSTSAGSAMMPAVDLQAQVDELRAEVAYARAVLTQLRTKGQAGVLPGPPPGLSSTTLQ